MMKILLVFCDLGLRCDYDAYGNDTLTTNCVPRYSCTWLPWLPDVFIAKMVILPLSHSQDLGVGLPNETRLAGFNKVQS